jgi:archaellum component FlaG (FlaF/FlaG flagellin family)
MLGKRRVRASAAIVLAVVALVVAALAAGGCGETVIDSGKAAAALEENLRKSAHKRVSSVDCPSEVKVEPGASFECTVNLAGGRTETATLKILDKKADIEVTGLGAKK